MYLNAIRLMNPYKLDAYTKVDNLVPLLSLGFNSRTMPTADFFVYLFQYVNELSSVTDTLPRTPRKDEGSYVLSLRRKRWSYCSTNVVRCQHL